MTAKITMLGRRMVTEESNIVKIIRKNNTREKEMMEWHGKKTE